MALYYVSSLTTVPSATHSSITALNADGTVISGDTVYFNRGETFGGATLAADTGVTYDAYGTGADPIIDGENTLDCVLVSSRDSITLQNIELINGVRCLLILGASDNLTVNDVVIRGSVTSNITTECVEMLSSSGTGMSFNDVTIHQGNGASKGIRFSLSSGGVFTNLTMLGVVGQTTINAIEVLSNTSVIELNNFILSGWNTTGSAGRLLYLRGANITSTGMSVINCNGEVEIKENGAIASNIIISGLTFSDNTGIFSSVDHATLAPSITINGIIVENNLFSFAGGTDVTLTNGAFINSRLLCTSAVDLFNVTDVTINGTPAIDGLSCGAIVSTLANVIVSNSGARGIFISAGVAALYNCSAIDGVDDGLVMEGSAVVTDWFGLYSNNALDGASANGTGTLNCNGTTSNDNGSIGEASSGDGFTAHNTATLNISGCQASGNWKSGVGVTDDSSGSIRNCTFYNNYNTATLNDWGIYINGTGSWEVEGNITEGHLLEILITAAAVGGAGVTINNNCYNNTRVVDAFNWGGTPYNWADWLTNSGQDVDSINDDPLFNDKSNYDLSLTVNSPCVSTGTKWWTGINPVGSDGEPFADTETDMGAIQSKHSPNHPDNL